MSELQEKVKELEELVRILQQQIVSLQNRMRVIEGTSRYPSFTPIGDPYVFLPEPQDPYPFN